MPVPGQLSSLYQYYANGGTGAPPGGLTVNNQGDPASAVDWWSTNAPPTGDPQSQTFGPIGGTGATIQVQPNTGQWQNGRSLYTPQQGQNFAQQNDPNFIKGFINDRIEATQGRPATDQDYNYWLPKIQQAGGLGDGTYWYGRMTDPQGTGSNAGDGGGADGGLSQDPGYGIFQKLAGGMSPEDIAKADPGFSFALQQATDAIQKSAAAKGTLLTGGTLKDLQTRGVGLALQDYGNVFNRNLQLAGLGSGMFNQAFNRNLSLADLGYGAAQGQNALASSYGSNVANLLGQQGNAAAAGSTAQGNIWGNTLGGLGTLGGLYAWQQQNPSTTNYSGVTPQQTSWWQAGNQGPVL